MHTEIASRYAVGRIWCSRCAGISVRVYRKTALQGILAVDAAAIWGVLPFFLVASTRGERCGGDYL